jgi:proline iminopeptidase
VHFRRVNDRLPVIRATQLEMSSPMRAPFLTLFAVVAGATAVTGCGLTDPDQPGNLVPATVMEDQTLPAIEVNGSRFHAQTFGDLAKPVIIFLHGGPGADYRGLLPLASRQNGYSLADDYFLVFWDQRGSGLSQRFGKSKLNIDTYDADLDAVIDKYSPTRKVFLVGQSWGGMYASEYIGKHPERVAGAVLLEPGPLNAAYFDRVKDGVRKLDLFAEWLNDYAWSSQFISADGHARMDYEMLLGLKGSQPRFHDREDVDPEPVWRLGAAANRYLMESGMNSKGVADYDFTANLSRFTTPVLFVAGGLSEVLGESLQRAQVKEYPSASLVVIPGEGHDVHWTQPAKVVSLIRDYLMARRAAL